MVSNTSQEIREGTLEALEARNSTKEHEIGRAVRNNAK